MRLFISEPCYIESDGPILIEPFRGVTVDSVPVTTTLPAKHNNYPATRKPQGRIRKHCAYCHRAYNGTKQQLYCSPEHKRMFYANGDKGLPQELDIHAGATGVDVKVTASK